VQHVRDSLKENKDSSSSETEHRTPLPLVRGASVCVGPDPKSKDHKANDSPTEEKLRDSSGTLNEEKADDHAPRKPRFTREDSADSRFNSKRMKHSTQTSHRIVVNYQGQGKWYPATYKGRKEGHQHWVIYDDTPEREFETPWNTIRCTECTGTCNMLSRRRLGRVSPVLAALREEIEEAKRIHAARC